MTDRRSLIALWFAALVGALTLYSASLVRGDLNQDEGWYLYAGQMVAEGRLPYIDFASSQGPVVSFAYALAQPFVEHWGLAGGRLFTALLGLAGCLVCSGLAARLSPRGSGRWAALFAFMLVGLNIFQCYYTTIPKTYALTALLLGAGFLALTYAKSPGGFGCAALAGVLMGLAAGTRTSAVAVLPVVFLGLAWRAWKQRPERANRLHLLMFTMGAVVTVGAVYFPFLIRAPEAFWFGLVGYHVNRSGGDLTKALAFKAGFISRVVLDYFLPVALLATLCVRRWINGERHPKDAEAVLTPVVLWGSMAGVTLLHFTAPFPYDDYQVIVFPLMAAGLGGWLAQIAAAGTGFRGYKGIAVSLLLLGVASAGSSPTLQGWFIGQRDRIWWPMRKEAPLATLQKTASLVREQSSIRPGDLILTQDIYLAVETHTKVPLGLEMGPFSYFPDLSRAKATACHVLNREMLLELLETCPASVAAFSGYGLAIRCPEVAEVPADERERLLRVVESRYRLLAEVPRFGQGDTTLRVFVRATGTEGAD